MITKISSFFKWYIKHESTAGITLLVMTIIALIISNSVFSEDYFKALKTYYALGFGEFKLKLSLFHWINDALMAIFFLVVGLEIKREFVEGELSRPTQAALPIMGAVGGMLVPALIYVGFNIQTPETLRGWAIPSATDIAFSIGILSLLGSRVPLSLKVFLVALAIIDDMGAVIIIALFYTTELNIAYLALMFLCFAILIVFNRLNIKYISLYLIVGLFMWFFTHESGVHATIAGVLLAITIPHKKDTSHHGQSMLKYVEHTLAPYVSFLIMPIFAFANAGVNFDGMSFAQVLEPVPIGICLGLFVGKQVGVFIFSIAAIKFGFAEKPNDSNWGSFYGVGILTGIGFTMSLFVGNLAFPESEIIDGVKIGVLLGSLFSTLAGYALLLMTTKKKNAIA
ncbi:MAG: Na+/H+ antiporter NhaA [Candidatus Pelagibacter sp.]|nr:Na+/H+ antiporter NhaA [Candidatus Pelagibacter sp.]